METREMMDGYIKDLAKKGTLSVCAWCLQKDILNILYYLPDKEPILTHGICIECVKDFEREYEESLKNDPQRISNNSGAN